MNGTNNCTVTYHQEWVIKASSESGSTMEVEQDGAMEEIVEDVSYNCSRWQHCSSTGRRWGWAVSIATFFIQFICTGNLYCFGILIIALQSEFNVGAAATGWIPATATGIALVGGFPTEKLIKKFNHRFVGMIGIFTCVTAYILTAFMPAFAPMYLTLGLLYGIGVALSSFSGMILIAEWFPRKHYSRASIFAITGATSGMLALNPLMYLLVSRVGWRHSMRIMGAVILGVGVPACATFSPAQRAPESMNDLKTQNTERKYSSLSLQTSNVDEAASVRIDENDDKQTSGVASYDSLRILRFPEFWCLFWGIVISGMSVTFYLFYWVKMMLSLDFHESTASLAMTVMGASELIGKCMMAAFGDYLPFPKLFLYHLALFAGMGTMTCLLFLTSLSSIFVIASASGCLVLSLLNLLPYVVTRQVFPGHGTTAMTTSVGAAGLGVILGTVYGTSVDRTNSFNAALYGCILSYAVCGILFALVPIYQKCFATERYLMWTTAPIPGPSSCLAFRRQLPHSENRPQQK